jgi:hypothetical protein
MVVSVATRTTSLRDRAEWEKRMTRVMPEIEKILRKQAGFVSAEFRWGVHGDGSISNITTWSSDEDAVRFNRGGAAATIDWLDQLVAPPNPDYRNAPRRFTYTEPSFVIAP